MIIRKTLLILVCIFSVTASVSAQTVRVEMLFFQHRFLPTGSHERWSLPPSGKIHTHSNLHLRNALPQDFRQFPKEQSRLTEQKAKMQQSGEYSILLHHAWQQPLDTHHAFAKSHIYSDGKNLAEAKDENESAVWLLDGTLSIQQKSNKFLTTLDVILNLPKNDVEQLRRASLIKAEDAEKGLPIHLQAFAPLKSGELHYFDNPIFGALVRINE